MRETGWGFEDIPNLTGIGIGEDRVVVVVWKEHPDHFYIPTELNRESGFEGLLVDVELGGLYPLQGPGGGGGGCRSSSQGSRIVQGGVQVRSTEMGTVMGVFNGVQNPQQKYIVASSHVTSNGKASCGVGGQRLGRTLKDAGCGRVTFEGTSVEIPQGVCSSDSILGLGVPRGIIKPQIGMECISNSCTPGKTNGKVTMINFDAPRPQTLGQGSCAISILDMFQSKPCPSQGDSGGWMWNQDGYILGIITYDHKVEEIIQDVLLGILLRYIMSQALGVTVAGAGIAGVTRGIDVPVTLPPPTPTAQQQRAQQLRRQQRQRSYYSKWDSASILTFPTMC